MLSLTAGFRRTGGSPRPLFRMTAGSYYPAIPGSMPWGFPGDKKGYLYHSGRRCRPAFSADRRKPAAIVPDDRGLMLCFDIPGSMPWGFPRDKKGYLYHNSCRRTSYDRELIRLKPRFQTRDFAERCSDKVRVAICAPHAAHSIALRSIKTVIHAPGFYGFALQILSKLRFAQVI